MANRALDWLNWRAVMVRPFDYIYIFTIVGFTVYSELILKWRIPRLGLLELGGYDKLWFFVTLFLTLLFFLVFRDIPRPSYFNDSYDEV